MPSPTHSKNPTLLKKNLSPWTTSMSVLKDLIVPGHLSNDRHHIAVTHTPAVIERFSATKPGGYDNVRKRSRLHPDRPCPSLVAGNFAGTRNHIHPVLPRELTNREIARIQGFPDNYYFTGSSAQVAKQITNAVPIALGSAVVMQVSRAFQ